MEAIRMALDMDTDDMAIGMDGARLKAGSHVLCFALPKAQPCLSRILSVRRNGRVTVDNGRTVRDVDAMSCMLQRPD